MPEPVVVGLPTLLVMAWGVIVSATLIALAVLGSRDA